MITSLYVVFIPLAAATAGAYVYANKLAVDKTTAEELLDPQKEVEAIAKIPQQPQFSLKLDSDINAPAPTTTSSTTDSVEAKNFRVALTEMTKRIALKAPETTVVPVSLENIYIKLQDGINPHKTFSRRLAAFVKLPGSVSLDEPESILPAMAYLRIGTDV